MSTPLGQRSLVETQEKEVFLKENCQNQIQIRLSYMHSAPDEHSLFSQIADAWSRKSVLIRSQFEINSV